MFDKEINQFYREFNYMVFCAFFKGKHAVFGKQIFSKCFNNIIDLNAKIKLFRNTEEKEVYLKSLEDKTLKLIISKKDKITEDVIFCLTALQDAYNHYYESFELQKFIGKFDIEDFVRNDLGIKNFEVSDLKDVKNIEDVELFEGVESCYLYAEFIRTEIPDFYEVYLSDIINNLGFNIKKNKKVLDVIYNFFLIQFVQRKIGKNTSNPFNILVSNKTLKWYGTKAELIELTKALIENGNLKGKQEDIFRAIQEVFNIELNNINQAITKFNSRNQDNETKFLNKLQLSLSEYLKSKLEKNR